MSTTPPTVNIAEVNYKKHLMKLFSLLTTSLMIISCTENLTDVVEYNTFIDGDYSKICSDTNNRILGGYTEKISYAESEIVRAYFTAEDSCENMIFIRNEASQPLYKFLCKTFHQDSAADEPWKNGFGYERNVSFEMPKLDPGFYYIGKKVPIICKSAKKHRITIVHPTNTLNAYNSAGGKSLYNNRSSDNHKSNVVSFKRPQPMLDDYISKEFYAFVNENFESINYIIDRDLDDWTYLDSTDLLIIPGHNEYWTRKARRNFDRFVDKGGNALVLSGNSMWFHVRYDEDKMICYKDIRKDPYDVDSLKTGYWKNPLLTYPIVQSIGADFQKGGYGTKPGDKGWDGFKVILPEHPIFHGTSLSKGEVLPMKTNEYDGTIIKEFNQEGHPVIDKDSLGFFSADILAYDFGIRSQTTVGTAIDFRKTEDSGRIINLASTNWCSKHSMTGPDSDNIRTIIKNAIQILLE